ncbi:hypothetical protein C4561_02840 [candidate division WWE3 bacterium]|jgi:hypothetical protein|uniref:Uncharacterized protein n=1 Tax=candidate division WWE3 bacterium TaxID=2053526 RepID=A0A3A4ZD97_UNCKA|nr:MAG: hypothetical protein C4561_02840 [candidate division WWE3 bacterium]
MYEGLNKSFDRLIKTTEFILSVQEYRQRFGIPDNGFDDIESELYKNWVKEAIRKKSILEDQFLFIAKRCKNVISSNETIPLTILAYYFLFGKIPTLESKHNNPSFSIRPSGILGSLDFVFTFPIVFTTKDLFVEIEKYKPEIVQVAESAKSVISTLAPSAEEVITDFNPKLDFLPTTPGNGSDIVDRVDRDIAYLVEFGSVVLNDRLNNMKDVDFVINNYEDKNKPIFPPIQQMGMFLLNRGLYPIAEEYWKHIDNKLQNFNSNTGKNVNRGIPLANQGVAQLAQGKVIEGLFNIYRAYENDKISLQHLPSISIDPERDMAQSIMYTQFENRLITDVGIILSKNSSVLITPIQDSELHNFVSNMSSDKKLLFYITVYRFVFSYYLNEQTTNLINRSEIIRALLELALWFENELKRKDASLSGQTLVPILDSKVGQLNPMRGQYTIASTLNDLEIKILSAINSQDSLEIINARILACVRNFSGHNIEITKHSFFSISANVFSRIISFILYSKNRNWI